MKYLHKLQLRMRKRKGFSDLSIRQKRRRLKQQLLSDLGEEDVLPLHSVLESPINTCEVNCKVSGSSTWYNEDDRGATALLENSIPLLHGKIEAHDNYNLMRTCFPSGSMSTEFATDSVQFVNTNHSNMEITGNQPETNEAFFSSNQFANTNHLNIKITEDQPRTNEGSSSSNQSANTNNSNIEATEDQSKTNEEFSSLSGLGEWAVMCYVPNVTVNLLLRLLRKAGHDDLPMDARTLLQTPRRSNVTELSEGSYVHYGLENALVSQLANCEVNSLEAEIMIDINVDGLPLSKSSQSSLWPILGRIVHPRFHTLFVIGAYHYHSKPSSVEEFMTPFIDEYVKLRNEGFFYNGRRYIPSIRAVICDSPARCFVTCTKQYNGYYGCSKCTTKGTYLRFVTFLDLNAPLRTDEDFKNRCQEEHHTGTSPFERASLNMVSQFPLDYMHVILLGIVKKLLLIWLTVRGVFSASARNKLSRRLNNLRKWIPREFSRKPRGINEIRMWKATEFRLFLLYTGSGVLRNLLPETQLRHFIALTCACRILCDPDDCVRNNSTAKNLLVWFVRRFVTLYGADAMVSNVHNLIHINEDVKKFGPLDSYSAFPFENFMQHLKRLLRSSANPLPQLHRRLTEATNYRKPFNVCQQGPLLLKSITGNMPLGCRRPHTAIRFQNFYLSINQPDNCCYMKDGSVVVIKHIGYSNEEPVILGRKFRKLSGMPLYPFDSRLIDMHLARNLSNLSIWPVSHITKKGLMFPVNKTQFHVMPLLHSSCD